jgi:hypothetical protein
LIVRSAPYFTFPPALRWGGEIIRARTAMGVQEEKLSKGKLMQAII